MHRHRQRLAGQRRLVDDGLVTLHETVHRHDLAGSHEDDISLHYLVDRHLLERVITADEGAAGRALDEGGQLASRTPVRDRLERVTAGEHESDDRAGEILAQRQRTGHRDERDRVDADVAPPQRPGDRDGQRDEQERRGRGPDQMRRRIDPEGVQQQPNRDPEQGRSREQQSRHASTVAGKGECRIRAVADASAKTRAPPG